MGTTGDPYYVTAAPWLGNPGGPDGHRCPEHRLRCRRRQPCTEAPKAGWLTERETYRNMLGRSLQWAFRYEIFGFDTIKFRACILFLASVWLFPLSNKSRINIGSNIKILIVQTTIIWTTVNNYSLLQDAMELERQRLSGQCLVHNLATRYLSILISSQIALMLITNGRQEYLQVEKHFSK